MTNPADARRGDSVPHLNRVPVAGEIDDQQARIHSYLSREPDTDGVPHSVAAYHAEDPVPLHAQPPPPEPRAPVFDEDNLSYVDVSYVYRPDAMVPQRRAERAEEGWRGLLNRSLRCHLRPSPAERTQRAALAMVRSSFPASRTICVANVKGGSGKTPTALILAELLATLRRESIVAADLNELRGTLGVRADVQRPAHTVMDLLQYEDWQSRPGAAVGDLAGFLRRQESGALVLASSENAGEMRSLTADHCQAVRDLLMTRYSTVVIDTGNNEAAPPWQFATRVADVLIVPLRASSDHVWVAGRMLDGLHKRHETRHLPRAAIAVITDRDGARLDAATEQWLAERVGAVLYVPPDPEIATGSIRVDRLSPVSRAAWTLVAAAVAEVCARPSIHDYRPTHLQRGDL
jgi:MinD-like ATPase involved in chromosome partitioning or flagellar assembly